MGPALPARAEEARLGSHHAKILSNGAHAALAPRHPIQSGQTLSCSQVLNLPDTEQSLNRKSLTNPVERRHRGSSYAKFAPIGDLAVAAPNEPIRFRPDSDQLPCAPTE